MIHGRLPLRSRITDDTKLSASKYMDAWEHGNQTRGMALGTTNDA
jgi:hypothetical protein